MQATFKENESVDLFMAEEVSKSYLEVEQETVDVLVNIFGLVKRQIGSNIRTASLPR